MSDAPIPPEVQEDFAAAVRLHSQGDVEAAAAQYRWIISRGVTLPEPFLNLALIELERGRRPEAILLLKRALEMRPAFNPARRQLLRLLDQEREDLLRGLLQHQPDDLDAYEQLLSLRSDDPAALAAAAAAYWRQRDVVRAEELARKSLELRPNSMHTWVTLGSSLKRQGKFVEAEQALRKALQLDPNAAIPHWNLSLIRLLFEDYDDAWPHYEWRWKVDGFPSPRRDFAQPAWTGGPLAGKRLLVTWEQGFGDTIQFVRYLPLLKARGATVIFEAQPNLVRLLEGMEGIDELAVYQQPLPPFDLHVPLLTVPGLLGAAFDPRLSRDGYLRAAPELVAEWRRRLEPLKGLRVGLVWGGNPDYDYSQFRSPGFQRFTRLLNVPGVSFVSLQVGGLRQDLATLPDAARLLPDLGGALRDFADTAAAVENLDLVIASDTGVVHLCGALGRPVWVLSAYPADWRWGLDRTDCHWYRSVRLFRQKGFRDDWREPFAEISSELRRDMLRVDKV